MVSDSYIRLSPNNHIIMPRFLEDKIKEHLQKHIPHRLNLLLSHVMMEKHLNGICPQYRKNINYCMLEVSMVAARMFIEFLGLRRDSKTGQLIIFNGRSREHDVRLCHLVSDAININDIVDQDRTTLASMYYTTNKAVAHLTSGGGDVEVFQSRKNLAIILKLLDKYLYQKHGEKFPVDIKEFLEEDDYYWSYEYHMDRMKKA